MSNEIRILFGRTGDALRYRLVPSWGGDATKAQKKLKWKPAVNFEALVNMMVDADLKRWKHLTR